MAERPTDARPDGWPDSAIVVADEVTRVATRHGTTTTLLAPTNMVLRRGELVVLAGPSGSGKTTLCNIVLGWDRPDSGVVRWADLDARGWARVAVAPQRLALTPSLTVRENIVLPCWAAHLPAPEGALVELAAMLEIDGLLGRHPGELSFGEQQRAAIARALLGTPCLAVLDEPTGHQDERRAARVIEALLAARSGGSCVLVATHDEDVIAAADQVIQLRSPVASDGGLDGGER